MCPRFKMSEFLLKMFPLILWVLIHSASSQTGSPCFWSQCYLSTSNPCPHDTTNTTSKSCFWGAGTMYQCCRTGTTTPSDDETTETEITTPEESSVTEESSGEAENVDGKPVTQEPVNLFQCAKVKPKRHPYIVALLQQKDKKVTHFCSGAIVSEWYVLTSASCVVDRNASSIKASAANLNLTHFEYTEQTIMVRRIHIHGDFKNDDPMKKSDLALLEMEHSFSLWSEHVQPIHMTNDSSFVDAPDKAGTVTGWEIRDLNGNGSAALKKADIPFVAKSECVELYENRVEPIGIRKLDTEKQICAASGPNHSECIENYGSPLVTRASDGTLYLIGVSSLHSNSTQVPNVYTDVAYFRDYIHSKILSRQ